jgi:hypothetical protein
MGNRYKFFENVYNEETHHWQKGLMERKIKDLFSTDEDIIYEVPKKEEYRPDLIAYKFYGDPKLSWVLIYVNECSNSPEEFFEGAVIRIPHYNRVLELV